MQIKRTDKILLTLFLGIATLCFCSGALCGDGIVQGAEQCDDGNTISHDGCSSTCVIESIAVQTWYSNSSCEGKIVKAVVFNNREWRTPTSPTDWRLPGLCSSGIHCECPDGTPSCSDGSQPDQCICQSVTCARMVKTFSMGCMAYPANSSNASFFYNTLCYSSFPNFSSTDQRSVSGSFLISKGWRLTRSSSSSGAVKADISAWELARARAIASSYPDVWHVWATKTCLPSQNNLLPEGPASSPLYEYHDNVQQRAKLGCSDMSCSSCERNLYIANYVCNQSLTCQVLSPGSCRVCTGGVADTKLEGFAVWPGPPAPQPYKCAPCSQAPSNYFYRNTECQAGKGCGSCGLDLPSWPVVFWPGMACGACGQQDAPETACGNPRQGGKPYTWIN
uniref:Uncharacterized protein n=1 Tax=Hanusia phi TaxID=3032 RepID=A0A7S0EYN5_9CRYP|mmetsp:Transcript_33479/g.75116  ORF Transcript_33479/g.75116 Transcript_33479/m.75116 type:complete len:393 (+) Transcript_33479:287-1465(+)